MFCIIFMYLIDNYCIIRHVSDLFFRRCSVGNHQMCDRYCFRVVVDLVNVSSHCPITI